MGGLFSYLGLGGVLWEAGGDLCTDAEAAAGSSELFCRGDPDVGAGLLLDDELDFVVDLL